MKNIKKLLGLLTIALMVFSCTDDYDEVIQVSGEAGLIINITNTTGKILGIPAGGVPLEDAEITFSAVELDFDAILQTGNEVGVSKYEIVKTFNGGNEVTVAETNSLPFNVVYTTIDEYISGFSINVEDIRVGDKFTFKVKLHKTDGSVLYFSSNIAQFSVVVNCFSDLAGDYQVTAFRDDGASWDQGIETIVEVSPGYYKTVTTGGWGAGTIAPDQGFNFNDTCNTLTVPDQGLAQNYYSNDVKGLADGSVLANGDLIIYYSIDFSSGAAVYYNTYVKQQ